MCFVFLAEHFGRKQHIFTKFGIDGGESSFCELCSLPDIAMESGSVEMGGSHGAHWERKIIYTSTGFLVGNLTE